MFSVKITAFYLINYAKGAGQNTTIKVNFTGNFLYEFLWFYQKVMYRLWLGSIRKTVLYFWWEDQCFFDRWPCPSFRYKHTYIYTHLCTHTSTVITPNSYQASSTHVPVLRWFIALLVHFRFSGELCVCVMRYDIGVCVCVCAFSWFLFVFALIISQDCRELNSSVTLRQISLITN